MAGELKYSVELDTKQLKRDAARIRSEFAKIGNKAEAEGARIDKTFRRLGAGVAAYFGTQQLASFIGQLVKIRGEFQQLDVAFTTMLNSKEKADKLMAEVVTFAAETPFQLTGVAAGAKQLLAVGVAANNIIPTLKALGDVSAGLNVPIERLILNYGQVKTQLKLTGRELRDFNVAGIPIISELAKNMDVADDAIAKMVENGQVGFKDVEKAFVTMSAEGGKFANLMNKQMGTITGRISNLRDEYDQMLNKIGESNEGAINTSISGLKFLVDNYQEVAKILGVLVATYGTYRAALIATAAAQGISNIAENIRLMSMFRRELGLATAAQQAFNISAKANPYILLASIIVGLTAAFFAFRKEAKSTKDIIDDLKDTTDNFAKGTESLDKLIKEHSRLKDKIELTKDETDELAKTTKKLADVVPDAIDAFDSFGNALEINIEKIKAYSEARKDALKISLTAQISEGEAELTRLNKLVSEQQLIFQGGVVPEITETRGLGGSVYVKKGTRDATDKEMLAASRAVENLFKDIDKLNPELTKAKNTLKNIFTDDTSGKESPVSENINVLIAETKEQIKELNKQKQELLKATDFEVTDGKGLKKTIEQITKALKEKENTLQILTDKKKKKGDDPLALRKKQLELEAELAERGLDLQRDLEQQQIDLEKKGTEKQIAQAKLDHRLRLDNIKKEQSEYQELLKETGKKSDVSQFDQSRKNSDQKLSNELFAIEKGNIDRISKIREDLSNNTLSYIDQERKAINDKYDDLSKRAKGEVRLQKEIEAARKSEVDNLNVDIELERLKFMEEMAIQEVDLTEDGEIKKLDIVIEYARKRIEVLRTIGGETVENDIKILEGYIDIANKQKSIYVNAQQLDDLRTYSILMGELGFTLSKMDNPFGDIGNALAGAASGARNLSVAMDKNSTSTEKSAAAINGVIKLIDIVASSARQRKLAEEAYYRSVINFQYEYNLLLNEQLRTQKGINDNLFTTDYENTITQGIKGLSDANEKFNESIGKLEEGQVKLGQKNGVDWGKVGQGVSSGAAAGLVIGTVIPVIGNVVGAVVGGLVGGLIGLFGGLKKKDVFGNLLVEYDTLIDDSKKGVEQFNIELAKSLISQNLVNDATKDLLQNTIDWVEAVKEARAQISGVIVDMAGDMGDTLRNALVDAFEAGEDAAVKMGDTIENMLENVLSQLLYNQIFGETLKAFSDDIEASYGEGGDMSIVDDSSRFFEAMGGGIDEYNKGLEELQKMGESFGFDLFDKDLTTATREASQKGFAAMSQDTGNELNGRFTAIQGHTFNINEGLNILKKNSAQTLKHLAGIENNTDRLEAIETGISKMENGIETINLKGIKLK